MLRLGLLPKSAHEVPVRVVCSLDIYLPKALTRSPRPGREGVMFIKPLSLGGKR